MIIPSVDLQNGQAVQLEQGKILRIAAGDPIPIAKKFSIAGELAVIDLDAAMGVGSNTSIVENLLATAPCRVGGGIRDLQSAREWLNKGAARIILGTAARPEILEQLPRDRLIASLDCIGEEIMWKGWTSSSGKNLLQQIEALRPYVGGFLVTFIENEGRMTGIDLDRVARLIALAPDSRFTFAGGITTSEHIAAIDRLGADSQVGMALYTNTLDLGDAISAPLVSDREDGLFPTVVSDEQGVALGLVYSSHQSIRESVRTQTGTYQSRKRGLWVKGATSHNGQELVRIDLDCDRDALRFVVRQQGDGFCHKSIWSCFGETNEFGALYRRIQKRITSPCAGSYTARLADDENLLRAKILEEARELADAYGSEEITHEAADLLYFLLVACATNGVSLADIESELRMRDMQIDRRQGEAKAGVTHVSV